MNDEWATTLVKSFYGRKRVPPKKIIEKLNTLNDHSWAAADIRVRDFFNLLYKTHGIKACEELVQYTNDYPLLRTILYSMLGHRYFDDGNTTGMRAAYFTSLEAANKVPDYDISSNRDKWRFSTNFYWARHDAEFGVKQSCLIRAMSIPTKNFHRELIITKFIRSLQWLMKNGKLPEAIAAIEVGKKSMAQFLKDGRITQEEYNATFVSSPKFSDAIQGTHKFEVGNP